MARYWAVPLICCLVAALCWQAFGAVDAAVTNHGLALPSSMPEEHLLQDDSSLMQDTWADEEYIMELERQEMEEMQQMLGEQEYLEQHAEELETPVSKPFAAAATIKRLQLPLEFHSTTQHGAVSTLGTEIRSAVEQARDIAAQLMKNQGIMKILSGSAVGTQQEEAAPVNVIELAQAANLQGGAHGDVQIDVTVTTERSGPTWILPSIFPNSMPSMFGMFGQESSSGNDKDAQLAAEIAQTVIESALANQAAGGMDQELVLDMTVENASPQKTQQLVAAAAAAALSAAASSAMNSKQPWDTMELQLDVVETTLPFFKSGRFFVVATMLLAVQLLLCFAVAVLWASTEEEEEEGQDSDDEAVCYKVITGCDLKKQQQQQQEHSQQGEWASLAEEGRGLYEKLLSYT